MEYDLKQIATDYMLGCGAAEVAKFWAQEYFKKNEIVGPQVFELMAADAWQVPELVRSLAGDLLGFNPERPETPRYVVTCLNRLHQQMLSGAISPDNFCQAYREADAKFVISE
jgi:hypothetical protein